MGIPNDDAVAIAQRIQAADVVPLEVRRANSMLDDVTRQLPNTEEFLFTEETLTSWRVMRCANPQLFMIHRARVREKCGNGIVRLLDDLVGPCHKGSERELRLLTVPELSYWRDPAPPG